MKDFLEYRNSALFMDGIDLSELAEKYSTPLYVYSKERIEEKFLAYKKGFESMSTKICYALKANSNSHIIRILASLGAGADVVSGGELELALACGIKAENIIFSGVSKSNEEIKYAIESEICFINIESSQELDVVADIAASLKKKTRVSFRVNPDVDAKTHPKISTGLKSNKFGIDYETALNLYEKVQNSDYIETVGVHLHIGSQITDIEPFRLAAEGALEFIKKLEKRAIELKYIDIGGGLGISYEGQTVPSPEDIFTCVSSLFAGRSETLILEPGRSIVGDAGLLLTQINFIKKTDSKNFVIIDAGFNDLLRPAMYDSYHEILPVLEDNAKIVADIVGPVCESGDRMAADREISGIDRGNFLAICDAGAYGFSMASNYNMRMRPAEILIENKDYRIIRRRENMQDILRTENEI